MADCQISRINLLENKTSQLYVNKILLDDSRLAYTFVVLAVLSLTTMLIIHYYYYQWAIQLAYSITATSSNKSSQSVAPIVADRSMNNNRLMPNAKSVFEMGIMSLPSSIMGFIIYIPDEAHHPPTDNKTISAQNANYIPTNLVITKGTAIAFVHGDPNHIHVEIVKDNSTGQIAWQTTPINHPGGSDIKVLSPGSYSVSDQKYAPMKGSIKVDGNKQSTGDLVVGGIFVLTGSVSKYKTDFTSAGFQVLSEFNFLSKTVQKDINGPTTLLIYSTHMPIQDAITKLKPLIVSLPYR